MILVRIMGRRWRKRLQIPLPPLIWHDGMQKTRSGVVVIVDRVSQRGLLASIAEAAGKKRGISASIVFFWSLSL